jgi:hypothetical protein
MDHVKFRRLSLDDQLVTVMTHGILLMACRKYNLVIRLFALGSFYVEVISNTKTKDVVTITVYEDVNSLDHLLEEIDITDLTV